MKNFTQIIFSLVIVSLSFAACEQEELTATHADILAEPTEEDIAKAYLAKTRSLVLFASLEIQHEDNSMKGYLIDIDGNLRTIETADGIATSMGKAFASETILQSLYNQSTVVETLSLVELADVYKQAKQLSEKDAVSENDDFQSSRIYLAFARDESCAEDGTCTTGSDLLHDTNRTHLQLLINASGHLEGENTSSVTTDLLEWLRAFDAKVDLG